MKNDKYKDTPLSCYGEEKQRWKSDGNYFTPEELKEMDNDSSISMYRPGYIPISADF